MFLWDRQWTREELSERVGTLAQLGGITRFEFVDGKAKGVAAIRVRSAAGLEFWVLPDKGMDVVEASYLGRSLSWHSPAGVVHPAYYDARDIQWIKSFAGGLVSTCGMVTAGSPSEDNGEQLGLHGAVSNTPAEQVSWAQAWEGDECILTVSGIVREAYVHGPNLVLHRTLSTSLSGRRISLRDTVENEGVRDTPLMQLYHLNFGFPLLTQDSKVYAPSRDVQPRNDFSAGSTDRWAEFEAPTLGIQERVYYHDMEPQEGGQVTVVLVSDDRDPSFGVAVRYRAAELPRFVQWKMTGVNQFALGLEPSNCHVEGRRAEREAGRLRTLRPGEKQEFAIDVDVLDGREQVLNAIAATRRRA